MSTPSADPNATACGQYYNDVMVVKSFPDTSPAAGENPQLAKLISKLGTDEDNMLADGTDAQANVDQAKVNADVSAAWCTNDGYPNDTGDSP